MVGGYEARDRGGYQGRDNNRRVQGRGGGYGGGGGDQQQRGGYGGGQKRGRDEEAQQPVDDAKAFLVKRLMTLGDRPQVRIMIDC